MAQAITAEQLNMIKTTLIARFDAGLKLAREDYKKVARLIASSNKSNTYAWLAQFPSFVEWVGARQHKAIKEHAMQVVNRKFETTVDVLREDIEDDNIGQYGTLAESVGIDAIDLKNKLVFEALANGFATACYDGQYFFDSDHPVYPNGNGDNRQQRADRDRRTVGTALHKACRLADLFAGTHGRTVRRHHRRNERHRIQLRQIFVRWTLARRSGLWFLAMCVRLTGGADCGKLSGRLCRDGEMQGGRRTSTGHHPRPAGLRSGQSGGRRSIVESPTECSGSHEHQLQQGRTVHVAVDGCTGQFRQPERIRWYGSGTGRWLTQRPRFMPESNSI